VSSVPRAYLELLRPANVVTALADVLAGFALAGLGPRDALPWLLAATACLYAGGVVLNDVFDRHVDRLERPERPIPSGRVSTAAGAVLGGALLLSGIGLAAQANQTAMFVAVAIAALVLFYDAEAKKHIQTGPVTMGACRGMNLLLGIAARPAALAAAWPIAAIPLLYIAGVTTLSRGEVHGGQRRTATVALLSLSAGWLLLAAFAVFFGEHPLLGSIVALALAWRVFPPFWHARQSPSPEVIRAAVRRGVLSLVLVDATIGAACAGPLWAALILATGLVAAALARLFAVT
jgi:4-hydroxybenzoate polyprenyltransferase